MRRLVPAITATALGAFAIAALSACSIDGKGVAATAGHPAPNAGASISGAPLTGGSASTVLPGSGPNTGGGPAGGSGPTGGSHPTGGGSAASSAISASVQCVISDYEDLPGLPHTAEYAPKLTWNITHATGMALSVDNPGLVGSYGNYPAHGTLMLGGGCYTDGNDTTVTFYSIGSAGPRVQKTIVLHPTRTRPTAPPFAGPTTTTAPKS